MSVSGTNQDLRFHRSVNPKMLWRLGRASKSATTQAPITAGLELDDAHRVFGLGLLDADVQAGRETEPPLKQLLNWFQISNLCPQPIRPRINVPVVLVFSLQLLLLYHHPGGE